MAQAVDFPRDPEAAAYQPDFARQAEHLCRLGGEAADLAKAFDVDVETVADWLERYPDFARAVVRGQAAADAAVTAALLRRACGFELRTVRWLREDGKLVAKTFTREVAPDRQACITWLRHRRPDLWGAGRLKPGARRSSDASRASKDHDARQDSRASSTPPPSSGVEPAQLPTPSSRAEPREARCSRGTLDRRPGPASLDEGPPTRSFGPWSGRPERLDGEIAPSAAVPGLAGLRMAPTAIPRDPLSTTSRVAIDAGLRAVPPDAGPWTFAQAAGGL